MPAWDSEKNFTPESFMDIVKENKSIEAHTLILIDIGLDSKKALEELDVSAKNKNVKLDKIIIGQALGTKNSRTYYGNLEDLVEKEILKPFCIIIPEKLHFVEKDFLESLR
jgi:diphthamide biosynthesis methyltransferase